MRAFKASFISGVARGPSMMLTGSPGTRWIMVKRRVTAKTTIKTASPARFSA